MCGYVILKSNVLGIDPKVDEGHDGVIEVNDLLLIVLHLPLSPPSTLSHNARNDDTASAQSIGPRSRGEMRAESRWTVNNSMIGVYCIPFCRVSMSRGITPNVTNTILNLLARQRVQVVG